MSTVMIHVPNRTAIIRQEARRGVVRYFCKQLQLDLESECRLRFQKSFDELSDDQIRQLLNKLAIRRAEQLDERSKPAYDRKNSTSSSQKRSYVN